jgi:hypothetical protein
MHSRDETRHIENEASIGNEMRILRYISKKILLDKVRNEDMRRS